jgi:hypothetical protein
MTNTLSHSTWIEHGTNKKQEFDNKNVCSLKTKLKDMGPIRAQKLSFTTFSSENFPLC